MRLKVGDVVYSLDSKGNPIKKYPITDVTRDVSYSGRDYWFTTDFNSDKDFCLETDELKAKWAIKKWIDEIIDFNFYNLRTDALLQIKTIIDNPENIKQ